MPKFGTKPVLALGATAAIVMGASGISAAARVTKDANGTTPTEHGGPGHGRGPGADSAALAQKLGVSQDKLDAAIKAIRDAETKPDPKSDRTAEIKALADALGTSTDKIQEVLDAQRPAKGDRPNGTTPPTPPSGKAPSGTTPPAPPAGAPSGTTPPAPPAGAPSGTTPPKGGPGGGPRGGHGPGGRHGGPGGPGFGGPRGGADNAALVSALAKATGKDESAVKAALQKLEDARKSEHEAREAAFAKQLAEKLGLDEAKVKAAIDALRPTPPARAAKQGSATTK